MSKEINILRPDLARLEIGIEGITPLLQNRFSEAAVEQIKAKQAKAAKTALPARDPEAVFMAALHEVEPAKNGTPPVYGHPSVAFKAAMGSAYVRFVGERSAKGLKGAVSIPKPLVPLDAPPPEMAEHPVKIRSSGTYTIAYRPMFWPWRATLPVTVDQNFISVEQLLNLLQTAGFAVGIGAWRAENGGDFGQFRLTGEVGQG